MRWHRKTEKVQQNMEIQSFLRKGCFHLLFGDQGYFILHVLLIYALLTGVGSQCTLYKLSS